MNSTGLFIVLTYTNITINKKMSLPVWDSLSLQSKTGPSVKLTSYLNLALRFCTGS